ncbi:exodeoxyribonuclease VII large subunit [Pumilibacter muris]|uniref:exodeoxyribonuclease VII large subunit n=1 Tax=Pumilibacter muris TaxID=2941510 RepID=UPI002041FBAB|nr:exodeoxyribonuclease VII large subunit [Pumilibacter muris]
MRERTLTVSQLNEYVKGVFEDELVLHNLNVEGEVYEFKATPTATFVTLREGDGILNCVCFEAIEKLELGEKVSLFGNVTFHGRTGRISFAFKTVKKIGVGNILAEFNALKEKLAAEGLFENKLPITAPVTNVAIVTSETGAVIHDFVKTLYRKNKFTALTVFSSLVQGKLAAADIVRKLQEADTKKFDTIVIARGGGSGDDLSVFNDESVVRAVSACRTPVISAVGHETDFTLCDFAASLRAGTPSMAGEYISRKNEEFLERFGAAVMRLKHGIEKAVSRKTNGVYRASAELSYKSKVRLEQMRTAVFGLGAKMKDSVTTRFENAGDFVRSRSETLSETALQNYNEASERMRLLSAKLDTNNPLRILSMGYAKLYRTDGKNATLDNIKVGDEFKAVLANGKLTARVTKIQTGEGNNEA